MKNLGSAGTGPALSCCFPPQLRVQKATDVSRYRDPDRGELDVVRNAKSRNGFDRGTNGFKGFALSLVVGHPACFLVKP